jgi:deazaflavin-dependent oxidoreductase (nitroreductase family)
MGAVVKDQIVRLRSALHRDVFTRTQGRLLKRWGGHPVLMLTTVGRRSGLPRTAMVAVLVRERETLVVVASDGGAPQHPQWYRNLCAHPTVEVVFEGRRRPMIARTADPWERAALWPQITSVAPSYARYQERAPRELPVVLLAPR